MKYISILGSTGSIGTQTLDIVENNKDLCVRGLAAGRNVELLEQQIRRFSPVIAALWDEKDAADLRVRVADLPVKIVSGMDGLIQVVTEEKTQIVVTAIVGMIGIRPTMEAIMAGKDIALAINNSPVRSNKSNFLRNNKTSRSVNVSLFMFFQFIRILSNVGAKLRRSAWTGKSSRKQIPPNRYSNAQNTCYLFR